MRRDYTRVARWHNKLRQMLPQHPSTEQVIQAPNVFRKLLSGKKLNYLQVTFGGYGVVGFQFNSFKVNGLDYKRDR
jgi:hypothetical protein